MRLPTFFGGAGRAMPDAPACGPVCSAVGHHRMTFSLDHLPTGAVAFATAREREALADDTTRSGEHGSVLAHSRLIDSVAAFTHHRDIDALDHSLVLSLAELTGARRVSLGKRLPEGSSELVSHVCCTADEQGRYEVSAAGAEGWGTTHRLLQSCIDRPQVRAEVRADGSHRLIVPMLRDGCALGALEVESLMPAAAMRPLVEGFARIYANYTALLHESERDKLTGLYNRRTFERHLQRLLHPEAMVEDDDQPAVTVERRHASAMRGVWLAIMDIDHFKRVNDTYGHLYGDEVILLLAQQMRECFRHGDVLFRFGGEEFVVMLAAQDESVARSVLERFRQRVGAHLFPQVEHVTVSIGYARMGAGDYPTTVLDRADKALYHAKEHGRNCVHGYEALAAQGLLSQSAAPGSIDLF
jgi:diguanylate cyclase (GGDEF)-like protein